MKAELSIAGGGGWVELFGHVLTLPCVASFSKFLPLIPPSDFTRNNARKYPSFFVHYHSSKTRSCFLLFHWAFSDELQDFVIPPSYPDPFYRLSRPRRDTLNSSKNMIVALYLCLLSYGFI